MPANNLLPLSSKYTLQYLLFDNNTLGSLKYFALNVTLSFVSIEH